MTTDVIYLLVPPHLLHACPSTLRRLSAVPGVTMPKRARSNCPIPGCPNLTEGGRCEQCRREARKARDTSAHRYNTAGHRRFRRAVLAKHPICVMCRKVRSVIADHWPLSKRDLLRRGMDANDPQYGRGLCWSCHSKATAENQPGGWNAEQSR